MFFLSNKPRIKVIDEILKGQIFDYLRPEGTITYTIDIIYNIPIIDIKFDGWFESIFCIWPKDNRARSDFLSLERTPSISSLFESGTDTVF